MEGRIFIGFISLVITSYIREKMRVHDIYRTYSFHELFHVVTVDFNDVQYTIKQIRRIYSESGLEAALHHKTRITPAVASKITGNF